MARRVVVDLALDQVALGDLAEEEILHQRRLSIR
jgi:hypothetical protein